MTSRAYFFWYIMSLVDTFSQKNEINFLIKNYLYKHK